MNKKIIIFAILFAIFVKGYVKVPPMTTFQYQLQGTIDFNINAKVFFIDLFDAIDKGNITKLKSQGKIVFCYFSAGSYEDFRPDAKDFPKSIIAGSYSGYPNEWWLDIRNFEASGLAAVMRKRIDLAATNGCDGVDPDNINVYQNESDSKITITADQQILFNKFIADYSHSKNLAVSLKNDGSQVAQLVDYFDVAVNESCYEYNECDYLDQFIKQNKAAFGISYKDQFPDKTKDWQGICKVQMAKSYTWILKNKDLLSPIASCGNEFADTIDVNYSIITTPLIVFLLVIQFIF